MKRLLPIVFVCLLGFLRAEQASQPVIPGSSPDWPVIQRRGDQLFEGDKVFRFFGLCASTSNMTKEQILPDWSNRWPDAYEIEDVFDGLDRLGAKVTRVGIGLSMYSAKDRHPHVHVQARRTYNEDAFKALDRVLDTARRHGIRVIFPFIASQTFPNTRGVDEFAAMSGRSNFWSDKEVREDFKHLVSFILNRVNTVNGIVYKDDATILAWQYGNEFDSYAGDRGYDWNEYAPQIQDWCREIGAYIKQVDGKHLLIECGGFHKKDILADPNIDIISSHLYEYWAKVKNEPYLLAPMAHHERQITKGIKPLIVDELGLATHDNLKSLLDTIREEGIVGGLLWGIRGHRRDGGWYYHNEGGTNVNSYHVPGFPAGYAYDEIRTLDLMRQQAYLIRGETPPPVAKPSGTPVLLPLKERAFTWRGCAGAAFYTLERAETPAGPWQLSVTGLHDSVIADVKTHEAKKITAPTILWHDESAEAGKSYYYRIRATNASGDTPWSTLVEVRH
jgi:mannan endo-1,4-beta-mannosidase